MKAIRVYGLAASMCLFACMAAAQDGAELLVRSGVQGGVVVHLGCGDGILTEQLAAGGPYVVQGLDTDAANVAAARKRLLAAGCYGAVTVDHWDGKRLPYVDSFVNLIVADAPAQAPMEEFLRALAPNGVVLGKHDGRWQKTVKPWPREMDCWTHYFHGPDGNPCGNDTLTAPPSDCNGSAVRRGQGITTIWPV